MIFRLAGRFFLLLITISLLGAAGMTLWAISLLPELPQIESIDDLNLKVPLRIYSADGLLMAEYGDERRIPVTIDETPETLKNAILAAEDDRFYTHTGVDFVGIIRAMFVNIRARAIEQGASTITMQVARNYFLTRDRTYIRKAKEALLAFQLERLLSKDQILELYVNKIFLGHRSYGFAAAARTYYAKPLSDLSLEQVAMLAALPKSPSQVNPLTDPQAARERRNYVLDRMLQLDYVTQEEFDQAVAAELSAENHIAEVELDAPYVAEQIRSEMFDKFGQRVYEDGYQVYSTVWSNDQVAAARSLREGLFAYDMRHGYRGAVHYVDLAAVESDEARQVVLREVPSSGELIPALVLEVGEHEARALTEQAGTVTIPWESMQWARPHISSRSMGKAPSRPADVVRGGDVVYIRPAEDGWRFSQWPEIEGALVAVSPGDGAIRAMQGGFDYYAGKFNRVSQAKRQLGSNVKPFVYSAALESGYSASSLVSGAPVVVEDESSELVWRPENYSGKFFGPTRLRKALSLSLNLVSVRLVRSMGAEFTKSYLTKFGFDEEALPDGLSIALGTAEVTPLSVASGYAVFANGGHAIEPYIIDVVKDRDGKPIMYGRRSRVCEYCLSVVDRDFQAIDEESELELSAIAPRAIPSANAYIMNSMLRAVVRSGTARKALALNRSDLAGKTGTTNNFEDAWFSGFNDHLVATAWVGFDQPDDLGNHEAGSRAALPIWVDFMGTALQGVPESPVVAPDNIVTLAVHPETGEVVSEDHPDSLEEVFVAGTEPRAHFEGFIEGVAGSDITSPDTEDSVEEVF